MNERFAAFRKKILNPFAYRLFLLSRLPLVYFTGIKITALTNDYCTTIAKYSWLNTNPFRSMYFAVMNMAAELSTGVLCMGNIYKQSPTVSMLVIKTEAVYFKKAIGKIEFTCRDVRMIFETIEKARSTGESSAAKCYSVATNADGEIVAEFWITWSFKAKSGK